MGKRVMVAGATGYLGKFAVKAFKQAGYQVRVLTRSKERLYDVGPFTAPALTDDDMDEVFVGEITQPETLAGLMDGVDLVFPVSVYPANGMVSLLSRSTINVIKI